MSPSKIGLLTVVGGGVTSSATYGMYYQTNSSRSVKTEINAILLNAESEEEAWGQHYQKYKESKDNLKIKDLDFSTESNWKAGIKNWCLTALETKWTSSNFYDTLEKTKHWCVDTENIGDRITRTLETTKEVIPDNSQDSEWETAWDAYNNGKNGKEIENLKSSNKGEGKGKIKSWCTINKHLHASTNKQLKDNMKSWCTRNKTGGTHT
ncbi:hypothetical protein MHC_00800 [Mycoplasma haemocanis str. Illinois]|uniref:Uncharacterized protein n=1 Tax=Mycoplasma haemocanis (strain Illinois) TaxID=1111676 RepID=H6N5R6_MYCHN|nr:hypothetical protein [Mycoplasma haemocanis]AEW45026.1 hypothetical protein MHC_00800 [Mycoplasma haemocanis str. Illinois]